MPTLELWHPQSMLCQYWNSNPLAVAVAALMRMTTIDRHEILDMNVQVVDQQ
jgi:hypothetical protein